MFPKSVLNVLCSVSVSTKVPAMKVTPNTMASAVRASRSLWASSPLMVTRHMSGAQRPDALQDRVGGRLGQVVDDGAVGQEDAPVGIGRPVGVVGDHDDGLAELGDGTAQERQHLGRGNGVQVSR